MAFIKKADTKSSASGLSNTRIYIIIFVIGLASALVVFRLYSLQVKAYAFYRAMADDQHKLVEKILPNRGEIFLTEKDGVFPVAVNKKMAMAYAVPREVEDPASVARQVASALGIDEKEVNDKLSHQDDWYAVLKRKLSPEEEEKIKGLNLKGIYLTEESWRYYPGGNLAAQTIGFMGYNNDVIEGRYGIEKQFENQLKGDYGLLEQEKDTRGRWISIGDKSLTPAKNGEDLILSLDHVIQFKAESALKSAVQRHSADSGKIIIMQPETGKVLAMASEPSFNINDYSKTEDINVFRNPVISDAFESGSVFKTITMAAGLDSGSIAADSTYMDTGSVSEAGFKIMNSDQKANGLQTMTNIIEKSLNTGVIYVEKQMGNETFLKYIKEFGFGEKTGVDLPYEAAGNLLNLKENRNLEYFTASFGQGITVTPLQLANAYCVIANGGQLFKPQIVDRYKTDDKEIPVEKQLIRKVISKNTANQVALMLESNVLNGHGKMAGVPGYRVAGKTGTAQIPDKEKGGYKEDATIGSFAGFAPVDNPQFVIVVEIDYPKDVQWAESTAAPVFGELAKFMFDYYGIEPTKDYTAEELEKFTKTHNYLEKPKPEEVQGELPTQIKKIEGEEKKETKTKKKKDD